MVPWPLQHSLTIDTHLVWILQTAQAIVYSILIFSDDVCIVPHLPPNIVAVHSEAIWDTKADVKKAARDTLTKTTALISNKDIERLIKALINPVEEVPNTIALLSPTTFVSEVDSPTLSLTIPLARGLTEKLTATKRKVAV
jgi:elongation factor 3